MLTQKVFYEDRLLELGSKLHYIKTRRSKNPLKHLREVKNFFKENSDYDYFWFNVMSRSYITPLKFAYKNNIKTITHIHGSGKFTEGGLVTKFLHFKNMRNLHKFTNLYFTCSTDAAKYAFGKKSSKSIFIPNAIDIDKFKYSLKYREKIRNELKIDKNSFVIGNVARLTPIKNLFFLIDIFEQIYLKNSNSYLLIVGDGYLKDELFKYTVEKKLDKNIKFLGVREDVFKIYSALDSFVMPSLSEGFPISLVEAQSSGLPCIVSDVITKEVDLINNMKFVSLDDHAQIWANYIIKSKRIKEFNILKYSVDGNIEIINNLLKENL